MALKKKVTKKKIEPEPVGFVLEVAPISIPRLPEKLSVDLGREDLNNIAKAFNELIDYLEAQK